MKNIILKIPSLCLLLCALAGFSQSLTWTGTADTDFYNEQNWVVTGTENSPSDGSLTMGSAIEFRLIVHHATLDLGEQNLSFTDINKGLELKGSIFTAGSLTNGKTVVSDTSTLILSATTPLLDLSELDLMDNHSWIKLTSVDPFVADSVYLKHITSSGKMLVEDESVRVNQYYFNGSLIRLNDSDFQALTLFDDKGLSGSSKAVTPFKIYSRSELGDFDNVASSFRLERGYQAVLAIFQNGKSISQAYIASEEDLEIDLPDGLNNAVSFVRVMHWNWVTKKGASGFSKDLGNTWVYNWSEGSDSELNKEFAPMSWGNGGASTAAIQRHIVKERVTHIMGFNESDNCFDQSGQYGGLCQIEVAVPLFSNLQSTGLRLVSPSPRENGPFTWLKDFRDEAIVQNVRYDVLGVHWYDWGANPKNTPFEDGEKVFGRFKNYLDRVYAEHGLPIWITEFNANANRDASVHKVFMQLALPYLETLDFVERYDYFSVNPAVAGNREDIEFGVMFDLEDGSATELGMIYKEHMSTPSIPEATWTEASFLERVSEQIPISIELDTDSIAEGEVLTISVNTEISVGAPQSVTFQIGNMTDDQYSIRDITLTIPEGGNTAETILLSTDDDEFEEDFIATIILTDISDGIVWSGEAVEFVMTSDDIFVVPLDVESLGQVSVYPNPTSNQLHIANTSGIATDVQLISVDGRVLNLLADANQSFYDISHMASGVYLLKFTVNNEVLSRRVIIE